MKELFLRSFDSTKIDVSLLHFLAQLTNEDIENFQKYKTDLGKQEQAISSYFKKKYVGSYSFNDNKKPVSDKTKFNISHSNGVVVFVQNDNRETGIDIEHIKHIDSDIKQFATSDEEYAQIKTDEDFFKFWVSKESLLKACGSGMVRDVKNVPAMPFDGVKEYNGKHYYSHLMKKDDYLISITLEGIEDFIISEQIEEIVL